MTRYSQARSSYNDGGREWPPPNDDYFLPTEVNYQFTAKADTPQQKSHDRSGSNLFSHRTPIINSTEVPPTPSHQNHHFHQRSSLLEDPKHVTQPTPQNNKSRHIESLDWRPQSLKSVYAFMLTMIGMMVLYLTLYEISKKKQYIAHASERVNWLFRFGPQFLAIVMVEWAWRMSTDLLSILPYIALSTTTGDVLRRYPEAALHRLNGWREFRRNNNLDIRVWLSTLAGSLLLVPFQSTLFSHGTASITQAGVPFMMVTPQLVNDEFNSTLIPSIVVNAVWNGVTEGNTYNGAVGAILWDYFDSGTSGLYESSEASQLFDEVLVLPFHPKDQSLRQASYDGLATWSLHAAGIVSWMECTQINDGQVTLSNPSSQFSTWDVTVQGTDSDGCAFRKTLNQVPLSEDSNFTNTISNITTFMLWEVLENSDDWSTATSDCSRYKHILFSGPMPAQVSPSSASTSISLDLSNWGAISCQAMYAYTQDHTLWKVQPPEQVTHDELVPEQMIRFGADKSNFDLGMKQNFIDTRIVYDTSNQDNGQTFWGAFLANSWVTSPQDVTIPEISCSDLSTSTEVWNNELACQMYASTALLWNELFDLSASMTGLALPESKWTEASGSASIQQDNWYLDGFSFGVCVFLHVVVLSLVMLEKTLVRRDGIAQLKTRGKKYRTGLRTSPASLAGKALIFHDQKVRQLFTGLDALKAEVAAPEMRKKLDSVRFRLKKGVSESSSNTQTANNPELAEVRIIQVKQDGLWESVKGLHSGLVSQCPAVPLPSNSKQLRALRYGDSSWFFHWSVLLLIFCTTMCLIIAVFAAILPGSQTDGIGLWSLSGIASNSWFYTIVHWGQTASFSILPTLLMTCLRFWWSKLDTFFRNTQPFVELTTAGRGKDTICLSYTHEPDIAVTAKAVSRRHWKLAYVTFVTFLVKVAIVLAGGIFVLQKAPLSKVTRYHLLQDWRNGTFVQADSFFDNPSMRAQALQQALNGFPQLSGWQHGFHTFPAVRIDPNLHVQLTLQGIVTNLSCNVAKASFTSNSDISSWKAEVAEGECTGARANGACPGSQKALDLDELGFDINGCTHWTYLSPNECPGLTTGRWWLLSVSNDGTSPSHASDASGINTKITSGTSIICRPATYWETMQVEVSSDEAGTITIETFSFESGEMIGSGMLTSNEDTSLDIQDYFAQHLNSSALVQDTLQITASYSVDYLSFMSAANMSNTIESLQDPAELSVAASNVYSLTFSLFAAQNVSANGSTSLLEQIDPDSADAPTAPGVKIDTRAIASRLPLLVATGIIALYCVSIPFIHPGDKRRTPVDLSYIANNISLVYDSLLMDLVRISGQDDGEFHDLHDQMFAMGVYRGQSGEMRMGVEVADRVTRVDPAPPKGIWKLFSSWKRGRGHGQHAKLAEETAMEDFSTNNTSPMLRQDGRTAAVAPQADVYASGGLQQQLQDPMDIPHYHQHGWQSPHAPEMTQVAPMAPTSPIRRKPLAASATWPLQRDHIPPTSLYNHFSGMPTAYRGYQLPSEQIWNTNEHRTMETHRRFPELDPRAGSGWGRTP